MSPFKSVGASVQSTASSRGVRISFSNAAYTMFGGGVRVLATHSIRQFPFHFPSRASPCATRFRTSSNQMKSSHKNSYVNCIFKLWSKVLNSNFFLFPCIFMEHMFTSCWTPVFPKIKSGKRWITVIQATCNNKGLFLNHPYATYWHYRQCFANATKLPSSQSLATIRIPRSKTRKSMRIWKDTIKMHHRERSCEYVSSR